jgi:ribosomal protein S18 acetylase RimI-like enzyme
MGQKDPADYFLPLGIMGFATKRNAGSRKIEGIEIREILPSEVDLAAALLGRAMRDTPLHIASLGNDSAFREQALEGVFRAFLSLESATKGLVLGAFRNGILVGACGMMGPGRCQLTLPEKIAMLPKMLWNCGLRGTGKLNSLFRNWSKHDPVHSHWHLGPVGVERELRGRGIGSQLLREFSRIVDDEHASSWLETDQETNVSFYQEHGFEVVAKDTVNGVPNWFMKRSSGA